MNLLYPTPGAAEGLYVQLPHGGLVRARVPDDAIIFMAGEGAASWLERTPLRALPHALILDQGESDGGADFEGGVVRVRSWHGRMFLPPSDALVSPSSASAQVTFGELQAAQNRALSREGSKRPRMEVGASAAGGPGATAVGVALGCGLGLEERDLDANSQVFFDCYPILSNPKGAYKC